MHLQMRNRLEADSALVIYLCALNAASHLAMSDIAEDIVKQVPANFLVHPHIQNTLIDMWVSEPACSPDTSRRHLTRAKWALPIERKRPSTPFLARTTSDTQR